MRGAAAVAAIVIATGAGAQAPPRAQLAPGFAAVPATPDSTLALTVSATGAPRTVQFVRAPVPRGVPDSVAVRYTIVPAGDAPLVTRQLAGSLPAGERDRGVGVSFAIPSRALAGSFAVARVDFVTADGLAASTTVEARVAAVTAISVGVLQSARGARPGETLPIAYRVSNLGNVVDTAVVSIGLPYGWSVNGGRDSIAIVVPPGTSVDETAQVVVARTAGTGSYTVRLRGHVGGTEVAADNAFVDVITPRDRANGAGPVLTTSVLTATGAGGGRTVLTALGLHGTIAGDVGITADVSQATTLDATQRYRLSTLGHFPQPPNVSLFNRQYRGTLGGVGGNFSDITGMSAGGRGVGLTYDGDRRSARVFGATAVARGGEGARRGRLAGGRLEQDIGRVWLTGTAAQLDEGGLFGRQLDVVGAGVIVPSAYRGGDVTGEMAWRRHRSGEGLGLLGKYTLTEQFTRVDLRAMTAPGGSRAFALGTSGMQGSVSHRISPRFTAGAFAWRNADDDGLSRSTSSQGWSIVPRMQLSDEIFVASDLSSTMQRSRTGSLDFGQAEVRARAQTGWQLGGVSLVTGGGGSRATRDARTDATGTATVETFRAHVHAGLTYATAQFGSISAIADMTRDLTNASPFPQENNILLRIDRVPVYLPGGRRLLATGSMQRMGWHGDRPGALQLRGDVAAELPLGFNLTLAADRNPLVALPGGGGWSTSIRLDRRTQLGLPGFLQPGQRRGVVFRDTDGDGRRGPGEEGAAGIMVRRGDDVVSTDGEGRFRLPPPKSPGTGRIQVDPRSLPAGWVETGTPASGDSARRVRDIAIVPTTHVRVRFSVSRDDLGASGELSLRSVLVIARDSLGRAWLGIPDSSGSTHSLPSLPPGLYTLEVDPSGVGTSLTVRDLPPPFRVGADREARTLHVELATRRVRMFRGTESAPASPAPARDPSPVTPGPAMTATPTLPSPVSP
ncbi:MAG: hypothetical protein H0X64_01905 [Gemmatimonadaceae bacterium]|nr:hypothetical protein [Gemmatimonadaceae bacterium]